MPASTEADRVAAALVSAARLGEAGEEGKDLTLFARDGVEMAVGLPAEELDEGEKEAG